MLTVRIKSTIPKWCYVRIPSPEAHCPSGTACVHVFAPGGRLQILVQPECGSPRAGPESWKAQGVAEPSWKPKETSVMPWWSASSAWMQVMAGCP